MVEEWDITGYQMASLTAEQARGDPSIVSEISIGHHSKTLCDDTNEPLRLIGET